MISNYTIYRGSTQASYEGFLGGLWQKMLFKAARASWHGYCVQERWKDNHHLGPGPLCPAHFVHVTPTTLRCFLPHLRQPHWLHLQLPRLLQWRWLSLVCPCIIFDDTSALTLNCGKLSADGSLGCLAPTPRTSTHW
jgi:hypothetical protein